MYQATEPSRKRGTTTSFLSYVKPEYRKGYEIPLLPYQTGGIICRSLWTSRDQVIRIIPGFNQDTGEVFRQNVNCNDYCTDEDYANYLSDSFFKCRTVEYFGENKQSFVTSYKPGSPDDIKYGGESVIERFINNVYRSINAKPGKSKFGVSNDMRRWASKGGPLKYAKPSLLMQSLIFVCNGEPISRKNENGEIEPLRDENGDILPLLGVVSVAGKSTVSDIMKALVEPANPGLPLDAITNNKYGGMAELDGNQLFLNTYHDAEKNINVLRPSVQGPTKGWTPTPYPLDAEAVYSLWVPWEKLIYFMTAEEQCQYLATEFGADAVNYLIGTDPLFSTFEMPKEIAAQGLGQYKKFVDYTPPQSVSIQSQQQDQPAPAARPRTPGLAGVSIPRQPQQQPARKSILSGVQGNIIDRNKLAASVSSIRRATGTASPSVDEQADAAAALLNDDTDYGDIIEPQDDQE